MTIDITDSAATNAWPINGLTYLVLRKFTSRQVRRITPNPLLSQFTACVCAVQTCAVREAMLKFFVWFYTSDLAASILVGRAFAPLPPFVMCVCLAFGVL